MAQVDPDDDSITRFIVRHYRYDPERHERRHVIVAAFDNEAQFKARMQEVADEIRRRRETGEDVDRREHASGSIFEPGHQRRAANGHLVWRALKRGISTSALRDLELPSKMSSTTAGQIEISDESGDLDIP